MATSIWRREWERLPFTFVIVGMALILSSLLGNLIAPPGINPVATQLRQHTNALTRLDAEVARLRTEIQALRSAPDRTSIGAQVASLDVAITDLRQRQGRLEAAIMEDPARALQVPLLRRDLDNLVAQQVQQMETQRRDVERLYQLLIGLFAALAVSILGPGLVDRWKERVDTPQQKSSGSD
jgi:hypothetical protein